MTIAGAHGQYAALCWRPSRDGKGRPRKGRHEVLLITSRDTGRWVLPKGWPIPGLSPQESAAQEAWEEAGVKGAPGDECIGYYTYDKVLKHGVKRCIVAVFPLKVQKLSRNFREKGQRELRWFRPKKAAKLVNEPELAELLRSWRP